MTSPQASGRATTVPVSPLGPSPCSIQLRVPQRAGGIRFKQPRALIGRKQLRRAGIKRRTVGIARPSGVRLPLPHQPSNLGAALETRIDQTLGRKFLERIAIVREMLGLPPDRSFPCHAEPGEVFVNRSLELRLAAGDVDILD